MTWMIAKKLKNKLYSELSIGGRAVQIVGILSGYKVGTSIFKSQTGDDVKYCEFTGQFGLSFVDSQGEEKEYRSGSLLVPEIMENVLKGQFDSQSANEGFQGIQIAYELFKVSDPDPKNARGYTWGCRPLITPEPENDPIAKLFAQVKPVAMLTDETTGKKKGK